MDQDQLSEFEIKTIQPEEERRKIDDPTAYFDSLVDARPMEIPIGRSRCSNMKDVMLVTTVGTGIAICMHEPSIVAGGLGRLLLPETFIDNFPTLPGDLDDIHASCEALMSTMIVKMSQLGAKPSKIRVKLFGGGEISGEGDDAGRKTYIFVKEFLTRQGMQIISEDIGQKMGRRIQFIPVSGKGMRRLLKRKSDLEELSQVEGDYNLKLYPEE